MTQDQQVTIHHDDCLTALRAMPDASVSAIVTDPPYGLSNTDPASVADTITKWATGDREHVPTGRGFMGKAWDAFVPPPAVWDECLRVLKPGGHMVVFAGSRTQDLMGLSIRLAGFDIRDSVAWLYGSGFPKSMDVSKAVDRASGNTNRERQLEFTAWMRSTGITATQINVATDSNMGGHYLTDASQPAIATADMLDKLRPLLPEVPEHIERLVAERTGIEWTDYVKRRVVEVRRATDRRGDGTVVGLGHSGVADVTASHSDAARQWEGWGTALKPAHEPVIVARKPLDGTVAGNVMEHGTGALNIDACRVGMSEADRAVVDSRSGGATVRHEGRFLDGVGTREGLFKSAAGGRWPANVVLDESQAAALDQQSGITKSTAGDRGERHGSVYGGGKGPSGPATVRGHNDAGGASRFFYTAKASKAERPVVDGTAHPTVKPLSIMRWLIRLITPPGGLVLEPFAGSGTTIEAAILEGFPVVGIEREADYLPLIQARIDRATAPGPEPEPSLFDDLTA